MYIKRLNDNWKHDWKTKQKAILKVLGKKLECHWWTGYCLPRNKLRSSYLHTKCSLSAGTTVLGKIWIYLMRQSCIKHIHIVIIWPNSSTFILLLYGQTQICDYMVKLKHIRFILWLYGQTQAQKPQSPKNLCISIHVSMSNKSMFALFMGWQGRRKDECPFCTQIS